MGDVLHVIFRYFIDTQAGVVRVECLLLHKGDANNVLPTTIAYCCVRDTGIVYHVPYRGVCIVIHRCTGIVPALHRTIAGIPDNYSLIQYCN